MGHELRQAEEDGRDAGAQLRAWLAAGGRLPPERAGASPDPAPPHLRALAERLLDELAALPVPAGPSPTPRVPGTGAAPPAPCGDGTPTPPPGLRPEPRAGLRPEAGQPAPGRSPGGAAGPVGDRDTGPGRSAGVAGGPGAQPRQAAEPHIGTAGRGGPGETPAGPAPGLTPERRPGGGRRQDRPAGRLPGDRPARGAACEGIGPQGGAGLCAREAFAARIEAAWVGRAVGCLLGKPVEKLPLHGIRALAAAAGNWPLDDWFTARGVPPELLAAHPWNRRSAACSLAENIDGMPEDDDLNYPLLNLLLLQRYGRDFGTADVGRLWLDELPAGRTFTAERIAYRNLLLGLEPPLTATHRNPFREWIGALIRADVHGWTNPGDPARAAAQAARDAALSHTGNGLHAARFAAATIAEAASGRADVHGALRAGLAVVPAGSRLAEAVRYGIGAATRRVDLDFGPVVDELHRRYGHYHWVHAVPNAALIAAALTHADGDFTRSVCGAVSGGWDTDSNGATAGSVAGLLAGAPDRLPHRWTAPLKNRLATTVPGFDGIGFDALARLTAALAEPLAGPVNPQEEAPS
ncbi:ADP-ribosylglycohydrolase family protein [Streptomyces sp. NPDC048603]|uniref:ADP-ribosylglycohydrolase family protein n=1 Tax=Streptomyces sp. NPDC048603 TaxID=3365577 RepID=UPI003721B1E0